MAKITTIIVGAGGIARHHMRSMLEQKATTRIVGFVEVSKEQEDLTRALFAERRLPCPPFYKTIRELLKAQGPADTAFICTPHKFHYENTRDCLLAGMNVFLEKPMVMNGREAAALIRLQRKTRKLLVVAFPGSLSPAVKKAKALIAAGRIGKVNSVAAHCYQQWKRGTTGKWRQDPALSGGGFLFDTGSHMVNTVVDLVGDDIVEATALMDNRGTPVEINASVSARTRNGIMVSLAAAGDSVYCDSLVRVFGDKGVLETGIWGGRLRLILPDGNREPRDIPLPKPKGVWYEYIKVRQGRMPNPCPPEVGLRFARLMDLIRRSVRTGRVARQTQ
jgi:predicted dehydrogenase